MTNLVLALISHIKLGAQASFQGKIAAKAPCLAPPTYQIRYHPLACPCSES